MKKLAGFLALVLVLGSLTLAGGCNGGNEIIAPDQPPPPTVGPPPPQPTPRQTPLPINCRQNPADC
jgi:hypothetical protein